MRNDKAEIVQEYVLGVEQGEEAAGADDSLRLLRAVYAIMNEIASGFELCHLMDKILTTTMQAVNAARAGVFVSDHRSCDRPACAACGFAHMIKDDRGTSDDCASVVLGTRVKESVLQHGRTVLLEVAADAARPKREIICAPLRGKNHVLGILYVECAGHRLTRNDMLLCAAVGNSAGLALENAALHREILATQRIDQELEFAWTIQQGFLVRDWPEGERSHEVFGKTWPAKTVGGDFYDYVRLDADHAAIIIGDVSGKGIPAALTMAQLLAEYRLHVRERSSPKDVIAALNEDLVVRSTHGLFCTMCCGRLDLRSGAFTWANAGHYGPMLRGSSGRTETLGEASGPPAGVMAEARWTDNEMRLAAGDTVLLYTDGIGEARREGDGSAYGVPRIAACAAGSGGRPLKALVEALYAEVRAFCAPALPYDDCTLLALRYKG
jgi:serine phosphatase RsbU (regulator of sigma subunit)